jgi:hypothetical protein
MKNDAESLISTAHMQSRISSQLPSVSWCDIVPLTTRKSSFDSDSIISISTRDAFDPWDRIGEERKAFILKGIKELNEGNIKEYNTIEEFIEAINAKED